MFKSLLRSSLLIAAAFATAGFSAPAEARDRGHGTEIYIEHGRPAVVEHHRTYRRGHDYLSRFEIEEILRDRGYRHIQEISMRGERYRVIAVRRNGAVVKLRVSAITGNVLSETRIGWTGTHHDDRYRRHSHNSGVTIEFGWGSRY